MDVNEAETVENVDGFQLMPYQFELEYAADKQPNVESSSDNDTDEEVAPEAWHVGNSNWCTCLHCGPMPTPREAVIREMLRAQYMWCSVNILFFSC